MKKILLLVITAVLAVSTSLSLEPMKIGFVYTSGTPTSVRVQLADNTSNSLFVGESYTTGITPNSSGIILVNVQDHAGSGTTWSDYNASNITTYHTLDIYVNGTLYAQYRLDALILAQAQTSVFDNDGNFNPPTTNSSLGTDGNRWSELFVEGNTVHIGPALGAGAGDELSFSYDDGTNTATMTVAGTTALTSVNDNINIPQQATIDGLTIGQGGGNQSTNTAVGNNALQSNTTGSFNTANGVSALQSNTTGSNNTANGHQALQSNTTGSFNTANGVSALQSNTTGYSNTANGVSALQSNTTGSSNTANGVSALQSNTTGSNNTANGHQALQSNTTGSSNTANGVSALYSNTSGSNNTAMGTNSLNANTSGDRNASFGSSALSSNTTGRFNSAFGYEALKNNTTGTANTAIGRESMLSNISGVYNTAVGISSFFALSSGSNNTAVGNIAGGSVTTGGNNVFIGVDAGNNASQKVDATNSIAIGANTHTTANNQVVIGNNSITETQLRGATLVDLAGGGTQNIQVDNDGKIITGGGGGGSTTYTEVTANTTLNTDTQVVFITGNYTVTLPNAPGTGQFLYIYSESTTATLDPQSKVFRDGGADYGTSAFSDFTAGSNLTLFYNGTKWLPIGRR